MIWYAYCCCLIYRRIYLASTDDVTNERPLAFVTTKKLVEFTDLSICWAKDYIIFNVKLGSETLSACVKCHASYSNIGQ